MYTSLHHLSTLFAYIVIVIFWWKHFDNKKRKTLKEKLHTLLKAENAPDNWRQYVWLYVIIRQILSGAFSAFKRVSNFSFNVFLFLLSKCFHQNIKFNSLFILALRCLCMRVLGPRPLVLRKILRSATIVSRPGPCVSVPWSGIGFRWNILVILAVSISAPRFVDLECSGIIWFAEILRRGR